MEGTIHDQVEQIAMKERETAVANDRNQQLQTEIEQKDREIQQQRDELTSQTRHLQVQIQMLEQQLNESIATLRTKDDENQHLQNVSILSSEQNRQLQDQLQALNEELTEKQQLHEMEMEAREDKLHSMQDLLHDKDEQIQQMLKEIESKEGHLNRLRDELDVKEGQNLRQQAELEAKDETIKQRIEDKNNEIEAVIEQQRSAVETNKLKVQEQDGIINVLNLQVEVYRILCPYGFHLRNYVNFAEDECSSSIEGG